MAASVGLIRDLGGIVGEGAVLQSSAETEKYERGYRYGSGHALAIVRPAAVDELAAVVRTVSRTTEKQDVTTPLRALRMHASCGKVEMTLMTDRINWRVRRREVARVSRKSPSVAMPRFARQGLRLSVVRDASPASRLPTSVCGNEAP